MTCGTLNKQFTQNFQDKWPPHPVLYLRHGRHLIWIANSPVSVDVIVVNTDVLLSNFVRHFSSFCISLFSVVICAAKCLKTGQNHQADTSQVTLPQVPHRKKHFRPKILGTAENNRFGRFSVTNQLFRKPYGGNTAINYGRNDGRKLLRSHTTQSNVLFTQTILLVDISESYTYSFAPPVKTKTLGRGYTRRPTGGRPNLCRCKKRPLCLRTS